MLINFLDTITHDVATLETADGLWGTASKLLRSVTYSINELIYKLIIILYEMFETISKSRLLNEDTFMALAERIGVVLGVVMLFKVLFSFITYLLDPNKIDDKEAGAISIIKKCVLVIVLLGTSSYFFEITWKLQNYIIDQRVIYKILIPSDMELDVDNFGGVLAARTFTTFYNVEERLVGTEIEEAEDCVYYNRILTQKIIADEDFTPGQYCLNTFAEMTNEDGNKVYYFVMQYNYILQLVIGLVLVYLLVSYVINVGVRVIQLTVLQMISPMAIISYLSPKKDNMFSKWWKVYFSTYIDVFIRSAIIYFVVYLSAILLDSLGDHYEVASPFFESLGTEEHRTLIIIAMILALLTFAKKAPELLKQIFPSSGGSGLGFGGIGFKDMLGGSIIKKGLTTGAKAATAGAAIGLLGGAASGVSRFRSNWKNGNGILRSLAGGVGGFVGAMPRGLRAGAAKGNVFSNFSKGMSSQRGIDDKYDELLTSGGTPTGKRIAGLTAYFGETKGQTYTRYLNNLDQIDKYKKDIQGYADEVSFVKSAKDAWEQTTRMQGESIEDYEKRKEEAYNRYKSLRNGVIDAAIKGEDKLEAKYIDINGKEQKILADLSKVDDDKLYASDIVAKMNETNKYVESHNVQYWDETNGTYEKIGPITNRDQLGDATTAAHKTRTHIYSTDDYNSSIANDKAAGVDSNGSKK